MRDGTVTLDDLDRAILHALHIAPRAPFSLLAEVLGSSEQTVARRYRRLWRSGTVRVLAVPRPEALGESEWVVRVQCKPAGAEALARALAQRDDVAWVSVVAGAAEVQCAVRSHSARAREALLVDRLPRTAPVLAMSVMMVLRPFVAARAQPAYLRALDADQEAALRERGLEPVESRAASTPAHDADDADWAILGRLGRDGRATYAELGAVAGVDPANARRRVQRLLARGAFDIDVDVSPRAVGRAVDARLWLSVAPGDLEAAGRRIAALPEVGWAAAITGTHNLLVSAACADHAALYALVTEGIGSIDGVTAVEITPLGRAVKRAGALIEGERLAT